MTTEPSFSPLALLGAGYIGGSVALAARRAGLAARVVGYDQDPAAVAVARERGIVDDVAASPEAAVAGAGLVVLAAPVGSLGALARRIAPVVPAHALVIDVGSVKGAVVAAVEAAMPSGQFVGCHPIAGNERSGPAAADGGLFRDRVCFVCPGGRAAPAAVARATAFWQALGARVLTVAPEPHDAAMAAVSHLPHVAAFALAASLADRLPQLQQGGPAAATTTSLRDTTRIAASSPAVWRDIFLENRAHLLPLVRALEGQVAALGSAIERGDAGALEALLATGRATREALTRGS
ncbi:MAG TPA: prephenate dehydrogenase/arogenate dehydrogenase family protein [Polyangia bacterium]|nr:prephenate dehydrogenase/arogenate dehydrogenase family protein [Polyangia bacterium]